MRASIVLLGCALVAICLSYLPTSDAVACTGTDTPTGCTDCTLEANLTSPDCVTTTTVATTTAAATTTASGDSTTTTASSSDTTTTTASSCGGKTRHKYKWKVVEKKGKKVIKRQRKGGKKFKKFL
ncbi:hypothetical protein KR093_001556 [Drosophila rubida]|uniref:Uncharacterized protein n=1 Tax=Drosophila rubida TaxID=30044 RepID=A0AAD4K631_9MUSC|nr:hypothetical protein KR093_001557 [Drosophila rubida]KAH8376836.1 hypothetical protein KR093_001556 [Drosophila rubida]